MPFQYIHVEAYARVGKEYERTITLKNGEKKTKVTKTRSLKEIMEEQARIEEACPHVEDPRRPGLLYGVPPMEALPIAEEWAENTKDSRGYKMKSDGNVALVGVASLPREMEDDFPEFAEATLKFLKEKYGDRLKSVVVHDDEEHPHLHFTVVPRIGERFEDIHEGIKAKNEAKKEKQKGKAQNLAYISAMREFQDNFYKKVGIKTGLTRLGPGRRRLTRGEWKAEQQQAKAFADAKAVAKKGLKDGYRKGIEKAKTEATEIIAQAQESAKGLGVKMAGWFSGLAGGWHEPSAKAKAEATKVKTEAQKALKEAQKTKEQAKKWADERVATVGNQIVLEKSKNAELEKEVKTKDQKLEDQATLIQWYQKNFGRAPDNLPRI